MSRSNLVRDSRLSACNDTRISIIKLHSFYIEELIFLLQGNLKITIGMVITMESIPMTAGQIQMQVPGSRSVLPGTSDRILVFCDREPGAWCSARQ